MVVKRKPAKSAKSTGPWVLRGKLRPPLGHQSLIERTELVASLEELLGYQASIVIAPAGYGKTTLLMQLRDRLRNTGRNAGWLTLDGQDADPYRFLCYVIFSLTEAGVDLGQLEMFAEQGLTELPLESVLGRLLSSVEDARKPVVLILDDYHRLESGPIDELMDKLIGNAPDNLHLIVSARHRPGFNVAQLCLSGRGIELDAEVLRFSNAEMQQALGNICNEEVLGTIRSTTEGWPVAVQLARLAYAGGGSLDMRAMTGREGHIAHFFSEQVVRGLTEELQRFLSRTAILDQFNLELANEVYGGAQASRILNDLGDLSALIVRLDEEGEWYRYHHLFAEFLTGPSHGARSGLRRRPSRQGVELARARRRHATGRAACGPGRRSGSGRSFDRIGRGMGTHPFRRDRIPQESPEPDSRDPVDAVSAAGDRQGLSTAEDGKRGLGPRSFRPRLRATRGDERQEKLGQMVCARRPEYRGAAYRIRRRRESPELR